MAEHLTVSEFAEKAGVTTQAIYARLKTDLGDFCEVVDGKKRISEDALKLFAGEVQSAGKDETIRQKDEIIRQKDEQIAELQKHIMEQSIKITELLEKQTQVQENYQLMVAKLTMEEPKLLEEPKRRWWRRKQYQK